MDVVKVCRRGHEMTASTIYQHPSGRVECRACQALVRKNKRHTQGISRAYAAPKVPDPLLVAALQAFHALGDALGWPERERP